MEENERKPITLVISGTTSHYSDALEYALSRFKEAIIDVKVVKEYDFDFKMAEAALPIVYVPCDALSLSAMRELSGHPKRKREYAVAADFSTLLNGVVKELEPLEYQREVLQIPTRTEICNDPRPFARYFEKPDRIPIPATYKRNRFAR